MKETPTQKLSAVAAFVIADDACSRQDVSTLRLLEAVRVLLDVHEVVVPWAGSFALAVRNAVVRDGELRVRLTRDEVTMLLGWIAVLNDMAKKWSGSAR